MITNTTKNTTLHAHPRLATSLFAKAKGFMFTTPKDDALIMQFATPTLVRLHMFFVFTPIDVVALNDKTVVACKEQFAPWTFWHPGIQATHVIELPLGTIQKTNTTIGDTITITQ